MSSCSSHYLILLVLLLLEDSTCGGLLDRVKSLVYPDPKRSETKMQVLFGLGLPMEAEGVFMSLGYVLKCNYVLPYIRGNDTAGEHDLEELEATTTTAPEENKAEEKRHSGVSRWSLYRMLERVLDKSCLLRVVCEAAEMPFFHPRDRRQSLLGELLHALLTPSMTEEEYEIYADRQYHAAEVRGRSQDCRGFYRDCPYSLLDYFSRVMDIRDRGAAPIFHPPS